MNDRTVNGVSIVVPTYNRARLLGPTLNSVKRMRMPEGVAIEVLVIDNNCTDETPRVVAEAAQGSENPISRIVETQQGLCFARNRGLQEARYEHVVYLDDDIEIAENWIPGYFQAVERLEADCVVGPVFPKFEHEPPAFLTESVLDSLTSPYSRKGDRMMLLARDVAHEVPGCNFGVRKSVAIKIGGFNNSLDRIGVGLLAGGDTEFGVRLMATSRRVVYQPQCAIRHVITAEKLSRKYLRKRWAGAGATARVLEDGSSNLLFSLRVRYLAGVIRRAGASLVHQVRGNTSLAFQRELEARRGWAYINVRTSRHRKP
jgi:glucosyl-dolichyl phosphate glucuronosyltransferase